MLYTESKKQKEKELASKIVLTKNAIKKALSEDKIVSVAHIWIIDDDDRKLFTVPVIIFASNNIQELQDETNEYRDMTYDEIEAIDFIEK